MSEKSAWLTIWVSPRATIRRIVAENAKKSLWILAAIYGFSAILSSFQSLSAGFVVKMLPIFILAVIFAPIWGYVAFAIWSWVVMWTGKCFKGQGDFQAIRASYAWSCVPLVGSDLIWIAMILLMGSQLFTPSVAQQAYPTGQTLLLLSFLLGKVVFSVWSLVIYLNALAEVQKFSILRAIGNVVFAGILIGIVAGAFCVLSMYILGVPVEQTPQPSAAFQILQDGVQIYKQAI